MAVAARPVVGLRSGPRTRSELLSQEVWGRTLALLARKGDWLRCEAADGMRGWVPASSVVREFPLRPTHVIARRFARLRLGAPGDVMLPLGSLVVVEAFKGASARLRAPDGSPGRLRAGDLRRLSGGRPGPRKIPAPARARALLRGLIPEMIGTPYLWGGKSTFGFDCSGLVQTAYEFLGVRLPRDSGDQAARGRKIGSLGGVRPLDLLFFGSRGRTDHVAIHMGELKILHASGHVRFESLDPAAPGFRADLRERFKWARRLIR